MSHSQTLSNLIARGLRPFALGLGIYYLAISVGHLLVLEGPQRSAMVALAGASSLGLFAYWLYLRGHPANARQAHGIEFLMALVVLANSLAHLAAVADPIHTSNVALALIGGGLLFLSTPWYIAFLAIGLVGWVALIPIFPPGSNLIHHGFTVGSSVVLSVLAYILRRKNIFDLEGARLLSREIERRRQAEFEKSELEQQLFQADKMSSLGVLAAGLAHDFNNVLTIITISAELGATDAESSVATESFERILLAAERSSQITREMLAFSGKALPDKVPLDLAVAIERVMTLLSPSIKKDIAVKIDVHHRRQVIIDGDSSQVEQIIMNLVLNALEAVEPTTGHINIATGTTEVGKAFPAIAFGKATLRPGLYGYFRVSDNGAGFNPDDKRKIFDPFYSTKFTGRGLGLASVAGILRTHDGGIDVDSSLGSGSTFKVYLPISAATERLADIDDSEPIEAWNATGLSALVVDDEAALAGLTADVLRCAGLVVQVAYGGQDGLEAYKNLANPPDVLVIDATMPGLDGRGLIRAIREIEPAALVILVSGYDASEQDTLSISGLQWFLKKPYTSSELLHCVRIAVNSKSKRATAG